MSVIVRVLPAVVSLAFAAACAHRAPGDASQAPMASLAAAGVAADSAAPCWGRGGPPDSSTAWERVDGGTITFCVPPGGEVTGRVWRAAGMRLAWGIAGQVGPGCWDPSVFAYRAPEWSPDLGPGEQGVSQRFRETIGGRRAVVWRFRHGNVHRASAHWSAAPRPWLCVESEVANDDQLPLRILRSVRFAIH